MLEQGLWKLLTQDSDVSALVSNRVYFVLAPKGSVLPQIVLSRVATGDIYDVSGATGFRDALFQVDCYATDYYSTRAISLAVRMLLESYKGNLPDVDTTPVSAVFTEKDWDMPYEQGGKGFVFRSLLEFRVHHYDTAMPDNVPANLVIISGSETAKDYIDDQIDSIPDKFIAGWGGNIVPKP
jgi:hypothetical protein